MLVDTNIWSELTRPRPDERVVRWTVQNFERCILSTVVQAEMQYGIAIVDDDAKRRDLQAFHDDLVARLGERIATFDSAAAAEWGSLRARLKRGGQLIADLDMLIAAHAIALDVPLVTRNVSDMERAGAIIVNPWQA